MEDTPEIIRQQIEETKSLLTEKLEMLEQQFTETVQTTSTAVNATVGAVQETVETVTDAVQETVRNVGNAFDLRRQIQQHPWLIVGGSVVVGYLAAEFLAGPRKPAQTQRLVPETKSPADGEIPGVAIPTTTAHQNLKSSSSWRPLRDMAFGTLLNIAREFATRAVPPLVDYLTNPPVVPTTPRGTPQSSAEGPMNYADGTDSLNRPMERDRFRRGF